MTDTLDAVGLSSFASRMASICDEIGAVLRQAALLPNIRDRLDFSCAIFDLAGGLVAQAAHIPVHLGSMAHAMRDSVSRIDSSEGDQVILNDPYLGVTHLPDVTLIPPVFAAAAGPKSSAGFVVAAADRLLIATPGGGGWGKS